MASSQPAPRSSQVWGLAPPQQLLAPLMVLLPRQDLFIGLSLSAFSSDSSKGYLENSMQGTRSFPNLFPATSWGSLQSSFLGPPLFSLCLLFWMLSICTNTQIQLTSLCWGLAHPCFVCTCSSKFLTRSSWDWQKDAGSFDNSSPMWLKRKLFVFLPVISPLLCDFFITEDTTTSYIYLFLYLFSILIPACICPVKPDIQPLMPNKATFCLPCCPSPAWLEITPSLCKALSFCSSIPVLEKMQPPKYNC